MLGPLIVWLIKKDTMPFVNDQGKEALNFQITVLLAAIVCAILILVAVGIPLLAVLRHRRSDLHHHCGGESQRRGGVSLSDQPAADQVMVIIDG